MHAPVSRSASATNIALRKFLNLGTGAILLLQAMGGSAHPAQAQSSKPKSPTDIINDAYSTLLNRNPTQPERQFWNERLKGRSPLAVTDLYDGLARLPDYRKRFTGLNPKAQLLLIYRTLMRVNSVDPEAEIIWLPYLQNKGLLDTIESIISSGDHKMTVYKSAGLATQHEADTVHAAEITAASDRAKAANLYLAMIRKGVKLPEIYFYRARLHEGVNPKLAIESLQLGLNAFPDDSLAELKLGEFLSQQGVNSRAFERSNNGIHTSDERIGADSMVIDMKVRLATAKHPECLSRELLIARGKAHQRADNYDAAMAEFDRALALGAGDGMIYLLRGGTLFSMGKYEQAIKELNIAEKHFGSCQAIQWPRGLSLTRLGRYEEALVDLNKLIVTAPFAEIYYARAKCFEKTGKRREQIADLTKIIAVDPNTIRPLLERCKAYLSAGKYKDALADANKAISVRPRYRESYKLRADCFMKLHNTSAAEADRKKIEQLSKAFDQ